MSPAFYQLVIHFINFPSDATFPKCYSASVSHNLNFFSLQILTIDHVWNICLSKPSDTQDEERDPRPAHQGPSETGVPRLRLSWRRSGRSYRELLNLGECQLLLSQPDLHNPPVLADQVHRKGEAAGGQDPQSGRQSQLRGHPHSARGDCPHQMGHPWRPLRHQLSPPQVWGGQQVHCRSQRHHHQVRSRYLCPSCLTVFHLSATRISSSS